jgi:hypothetical protein
MPRKTNRARTPILKCAAVFVAAAGLCTSASAAHLLKGAAASSKVVNFGRHPVGESTAAIITIANNHATSVVLGPLGIGERDRSGTIAFGQSGGTCFAGPNAEIKTLAPESTCTIDVTFVPQAPAEFRADLLVATDDFGSEIRVRLIGSGARE